MFAYNADALLTVKQVAKALALGPTTVRALIASGELPHIKIRGAVRVEPTAVRALIERSRRGLARDREDEASSRRTDG